MLCVYFLCLAGVLFFVQLLPAAITCFEYHKFLQEVRLAQQQLLACACWELAQQQQLVSGMLG
jgi:hypothetical protein